MLIDMNYTEIETDYNQLKLVQNGADDTNKAYIVYRDIKDAYYWNLVWVLFDFSTASIVAVNTFLSSNAKLSGAAVYYDGSVSKFILFYNSGSNLLWGAVSIFNLDNGSTHQLI